MLTGTAAVLSLRGGLRYAGHGLRLGAGAALFGAYVVVLPEEFPRLECEAPAAMEARRIAQGAGN
jgi:hypothetical protein